ncbi:MAG: HAMP domain-containing sensor histidine kinase [Verrucomicrobiota bacterium]
MAIRGDTAWEKVRRWLLSPWMPLSLLVLLAAAALAVAVFLSRQEVRVSEERDWQAVRNFALGVQQELQRLDTLYTGHVRRLLFAAGSQDARRRAMELPGVVQVSRVNAERPGMGDWHRTISGRATDEAPVLFFEPYPSMLSEDTRQLPLELRDPDLNPGAEGWYEAGDRLYYWRRDQPFVHVAVVDPQVVGAIVDRWLQAWVLPVGRALRLAGGPDRLTGLNGQVITEVNAAGLDDAGRPEKVQPLLSRFGTWHLSSWAPSRVETRYHPVGLAIGIGVSVLLVLAGALLFFQQENAARLARQRVSFVNRVSHELRTPLTNILLNAELAEDTATLDPPQAVSRLGLIRQEARRLARLIDNVLTFSRREAGRAGRVQVRPTCPDDVIAQVLAQFAPSLEQHDIRAELSGAAPERCLLDADALEQILGNLISNVEKYAAKGGELRLEVEQAGGRLAVRVADRGPGVAPAAARRIFRPFERLHEHVSEGVSGTGLGLTIARELAARMGGELTLLPERSGTGACFELRVPAPPYVPGKAARRGAAR